MFLGGREAGTRIIWHPVDLALWRHVSTLTCPIYKLMNGLIHQFIDRAGQSISSDACRGARFGATGLRAVHEPLYFRESRLGRHRRVHLLFPGAQHWLSPSSAHTFTLVLQYESPISFEPCPTVRYNSLNAFYQINNQCRNMTQAVPMLSRNPRQTQAAGSRTGGQTGRRRPPGGVRPGQGQRRTNPRPQQQRQRPPQQQQQQQRQQQQQQQQQQQPQEQQQQEEGPSTQPPATTAALATWTSRAPNAAQLGADPRTLSMLMARELSLPSLPALPRVPILEDFQFTSSRQLQQQQFNRFRPMGNTRNGPMLPQQQQRQQPLTSPEQLHAAAVQAVQLPPEEVQVLANWKLWPWRYVHTQQCLAASSLNLTYPNAGLAFSSAADGGDSSTSEDGMSSGAGSAQSSDTALKLRRAVVGRRRVRMSPIVVNSEPSSYSALRTRRQAPSVQPSPPQRRQRLRQQRPLIRRPRTTPQTTDVGEAPSRPLERLVAVDESGKCWNGSHTVNARAFADYVLSEYPLHILRTYNLYRLILF